MFPRYFGRRERYENLVFREDVLAWNYMLDDARKLAEERNVKFSKRQIRIGIDMPESTFGNIVQEKAYE